MVLEPVLLGLLVAFSFGTSDYLSRGVTAKLGYYRTTVWMLLSSGTFVLLAVPVLGVDLSLTPTLLEVLFLVSCINFFAFLSMYHGYQMGMLSILSPIVNAYPVVTVSLSFLLLGASLQPLTTLALAVTIAGILLVSARAGDLRLAKREGLKRATKGVGSALLATVFFGTVWAGFGFAEQSLGYFLPAIFNRLGSCLVGLIASPVLKRDVRPPQPSAAPRLLAMGALEAVGIVSFALGVGSNSNGQALPIVATLTAMSAAFTVMYSITLLKEKLEKNQALGILILLLGVTTLVYFSS